MNQREAAHNPDRFAVFFQPPDFILRRNFFSPEPLCPHFLNQKPVVRMSQFQGLHTDQFFFCITVYGGKLIIGKFYDAVFDNIHADQCIFDQRAVIVFRFFQGSLGQLTFADLFP